MLDPVPDARVRRTSEGWETSWMPPRWPAVIALAAPIGPLLTGGWAMWWYAAASCVFLLPSLAWYSTHNAVTTAQWNDTRLQLTWRGKLHEWPWASINSIRFDKAELVIEADGTTNRFPGPGSHAGTRRVLEHFTARHQQREVSLPTEAFDWKPGPAGMTTALRIRSGEPTRTRYQRQMALALAATLAGTLLTAGLGQIVAMWMAWTQHAWAVPTAQIPAVAGFLGALAVFALFPAGVARWASGARRGTVHIDAHRLTITAVQRQPMAMLWEDIESIDGDDQTLKIVVNGRLATFDLSAEPPAKVRGLVEELRRHRARIESASDLPGEAEKRRQQVLSLVGERR